jgi:hypothetical protein
VSTAPAHTNEPSPPDRWECGSDLRWQPLPATSATPRHPWANRAAFCGSGRVAFTNLIEFARGTRNWQRLWVPSYFCQEVVSVLASSGLPLVPYSDNPELPEAPLERLALRRGDAVLVVNYFGLRTQPSAQVAFDGVDIVEDHSHDPWSQWAMESNAEFCVVSLRKTLPVPDGGVLWSPKGLPLPAPLEVTLPHAAAAGQVLAARMLKALYCQGAPVEKATFRQLFLEAEPKLTGEPASAMWTFTRNMLECIPIDTWRAARRQNAARLAAQLVDLPHAALLRPHFDRACPVKVMLRLDSRKRRDSLRASLSQKRVYTAVLWSLDEHHLAVDQRALDLADRILGISCETDYGFDDMDRVANVVRSVMSGA